MSCAASLGGLAERGLGRAGDVPLVNDASDIDQASFNNDLGHHDTEEGFHEYLY